MSSFLGTPPTALITALQASISSLQATRDAEPYSASRAYTVGEIFTFTDDKVYRALVATSAGETPVTAEAKFALVGSAPASDKQINLELTKYAQYEQPDTSTYIVDLQTGLTATGLWADRATLIYS